MRLSIRNKLIIGYVLICVFSLGLLNILITKTMKKNNRKIITNEMKSLKEDTENHVENFFLLEMKAGIASKNDMLLEIRTQLSRYYNEDNIVYDDKNQKVSGFHPDINVSELIGKSMDNLHENIMSYDINYIGDRVVVDFPVKLKVNGFEVGSVRYFLDYTNLITMEKKVQSIVFYFSFILGILVVILSIVNSNNIVKSILRFKDFIGNIGKDNSDEMLSITSKDEIGLLANNINLMKKRITYQIEEIKKDKEDIERISNYRKHFYENMTHELKTPLTTIIGFTELSLYEKEYNEENLKVINEECNRLYKLVASILEMSYYGRNDIYIKKEELNVNEMIRDITKKMSVKAEKLNINLKLEKNEKIKFFGSKEALKTILINLIDNSIKYNKERGSVIIISFISNNQWTLIVKDNGIGISPEDKENIFKPFYKNSVIQNERFSSSGLGLAIVKEIIDVYGGSIKVESILKVGTKIITKIPLC